MIVLILTRILDIFTTLLNINKWGIDVEGNLLTREIMKRGLFVPQQLLGLVLMIILAENLPKYRRIIYISLSTISLMASVSNLYCYIFIK